ncbi:phosphodiesterase 4B [Salpingoeca rosetta]|uniref:Phosphodiesterase n=1 Tax=Salpingoeca rosetta (strain ATCC 50818 / BSB-021) TaxID=946362 RepID=F2U8A0_SALR5|nr:phosphodiesterase 4B [Salpingoeca rosetta]EGD72608.1 phosphodiesterase 4B [Salpingoeca rosetta]|eukprot:XP_004994431.1 phosphodiesterase 4B [Salpingoeca rosetta]
MSAEDEYVSVAEISVTDVDEGESHSVPPTECFPERRQGSLRRKTMPARRRVSFMNDTDSDSDDSQLSDTFHLDDGHRLNEHTDTDDSVSARRQSSVDYSIASSCLEKSSSPLAETIAILLSLQEDLFPGPARPPVGCVTRRHPPQDRLQWCIANLAQLAVKEYADYEIQQLAHRRLEEMQLNEEIDENIIRWVEGAYSSHTSSVSRTSKPAKSSAPTAPLLQRRMSASHLRLSSLMEDKGEVDWMSDQPPLPRSCPDSPETRRKAAKAPPSPNDGILSLLARSHSYHELAQQRMKADKWTNVQNDEGNRTAKPAEIVRMRSAPLLRTQTDGLLKLSPECKAMLRGGLGDWSFDVFHFDVISGYRPLTVMAVAICRKRRLLKTLNVNQTTLCRFMSRIEDRYGRFPHIPYHSNIHATDVAHSVHNMLSAPRLQGTFTDLEHFAAIVAAACHDVEHPGVNNHFLKATWSPLAVLYNNKSVLENHHLAVTFQVMMEEEHNILAHMDEANKMLFRELVIEMILGTDTMTKHSAHLSALHSIAEKQRITGVATDEPLQLDDDERMKVLKALVHCADLANPTKPWAIAKLWSERIVTEFFEQGDRERDLKLEVGPVNDRHKVKLAASQLGFIDFLAQPMWEAWQDLIGDQDTVFMRNLVTNRSKWQQLKDKDDGVPEHVRSERRRVSRRWSSIRSIPAVSNGLRVLQAAHTHTRRSADQHRHGGISLSPFTSSPTHSNSSSSSRRVRSKSRSRRTPPLSPTPNNGRRAYGSGDGGRGCGGREGGVGVGGGGYDRASVGGGGGGGARRDDVARGPTPEVMRGGDGNSSSRSSMADDVVVV